MSKITVTKEQMEAAIKDQRDNFGKSLDYVLRARISDNITFFNTSTPLNEMSLEEIARGWIETDERIKFNMAIGAAEKAIEENELLKKEIEELREQLRQPQPEPNWTFSEHLQEQNHVLRQCLKMVL